MPSACSARPVTWPRSPTRCKGSSPGWPGSLTPPAPTPRSATRRPPRSCVTAVAAPRSAPGSCRDRPGAAPVARHRPGIGPGPGPVPRRPCDQPDHHPYRRRHAAADGPQQPLTAATTGLPGSRTAAEASARYGTESGEADKSSDSLRPGDGEPSSRVPPGLDPRELRRLGDDLTYRADPEAAEERQRKRFSDVICPSGSPWTTSAPSAAPSRRPVHGNHQDRGRCLQPARRRRGSPARRATPDGRPDGSAPGRTGLRRRRRPRSDAPPRILLQHIRPGTPTTSTQSHTRLQPHHRPAPARSNVHRPPGPHPGLGVETSVIRWKDGLPLTRPPTAPDTRLAPRSTARHRGCRWPGCGLPASCAPPTTSGPGSSAAPPACPTWPAALRAPSLLHPPARLDPDRHRRCPLRFTHPGGWLTLDNPLPAEPASRGPHPPAPTQGARPPAPAARVSPAAAMAPGSALSTLAASLNPKGRRPPAAEALVIGIVKYDVFGAERASIRAFDLAGPLLLL